MKTSIKGLSLLQSLEGCELKAYPDPKSALGIQCTSHKWPMHRYKEVSNWASLSGAPWTIGFGDTGPAVHEGVEISQGEAVRRLVERLDKEFQPALALLPGPISQNEFDAMICFCYNIGVHGFHTSQVYLSMLKGDRINASEGFHHWDDHGLLTKRREKEKQTFDSGTY